MKEMAAKVIKELTFHLYRGMNSLSCHLRSPKIYSITLLNKCHYFFSILMKISHLTIYFHKDEPHVHKNPNNFAWDIQIS